MGESRRMIDRLLGRPVEGFCYPFGNLNAGVVRAVRDAGYAYACAVNGEENWDEYTLPRIPVSERDRLPQFAAKLETYWQYRAVKKWLYGGSR